MKKNQLPTAADLVFRDFAYSDEYPPIGCSICGTNIKPTGAQIANVRLFPGESGSMSIIVCNSACLAELKGPKAGAVTSFIVKEAGRLKRLFPKRDK
jgi:hypothetical protein